MTITCYSHEQCVFRNYTYDLIHRFFQFLNLCFLCTHKYLYPRVHHMCISGRTKCYTSESLRKGLSWSAETRHSQHWGGDQAACSGLNQRATVRRYLVHGPLVVGVFRVLVNEVLQLLGNCNTATETEDRLDFHRSHRHSLDLFTGYDHLNHIQCVTVKKSL